MDITLMNLLGVLEEAAELVSHHSPATSPTQVKDDGSAVTALDRELDAFLKDALSRLMPIAGWLSEETADDPARLTREWVWIVDPLDGTQEFLQGLPECAVSIALVWRGTAVAAGVINPFTREWGVLQPGQRPVFHGLSMQPAPVALSETVAIVSRTEIRDGTVEPYRPLVRDLRPVGSVAYKLLRVAAGADHLTFSAQAKNEWDICGGVGLLQAAGRTYACFDGRALVFNQTDTRIRTGAVAGAAPLVREFLRAAAEAGVGARAT